MLKINEQVLKDMLQKDKDKVLREKISLTILRWTSNNFTKKLRCSAKTLTSSVTTPKRWLKKTQMKEQTPTLS